MPKFDVYGTVVGSKFLGTFDAATMEEAIEKALARAHVSVCHECSREIEDPEIQEVTAEEIE